jgi:hypothetical protein
MLKEIVFRESDYFDRAKMLEKLEIVIQAFAKDLHQKNFITHIPENEEGWDQFFQKEFGLNEISDGWETYVAGGLKFFLELKRCIQYQEFLKENQVHRSYLFLSWQSGLKTYRNPLLEKMLKEFYKTYCMILDRKAIGVKYQESLP